jgi:hypothetical protein
MMNAERILAAIRARPGLTDSELRRRTGVEPHQQVNQICRRLAAQGIVRRVRGPDGRIVNLPVRQSDQAGSPPVTGRKPVAPPHEAAPARWPDPLPAVERTVIVISCSATKIAGGTAQGGESLLDMLSPALADELSSARRRVGRAAGVDESRLMPAWRRYGGGLYQAAQLGDCAATAPPVVILSGGYGVLLADDSIGTYDRRFSARDWPAGLLERVLVAVVDALGRDEVVAFCGRTTPYADLLRCVRWRRAGVDAHLAVPHMSGRRGAQRVVPRAAGEALVAYVRGDLSPQWVSSDGIGLRWDHLS